MKTGPFHPDHGIERIVVVPRASGRSLRRSCSRGLRRDGQARAHRHRARRDLTRQPRARCGAGEREVLLPECRSRGARPRAHVALRAAQGRPIMRTFLRARGADLAPVARRRGGARRARSGRQCRSGPVHPGVGADHAPHDAGALREACGRRARAARGRGTACRRAATARGVAHRLQLSARHRERGRGHRRARRRHR